MWDILILRSLEIIYKILVFVNVIVYMKIPYAFVAEEPKYLFFLFWVPDICMALFSSSKFVNDLQGIPNWRYGTYEGVIKCIPIFFYFMLFSKYAPNWIFFVINIGLFVVRYALLELDNNPKFGIAKVEVVIMRDELPK